VKQRRRFVSGFDLPQQINDCVDDFLNLALDSLQLALRGTRAGTLLHFGAGTADLIIDVLNVLNDTAEEALVSDNRFAATFGAPRLFIDPRRAMLGVRLNLGR
jgi:hypothetical protein